MMEVITLDDNEPNDDEDEELLLHDIDEDLNIEEDHEAGEDFKTLQKSMEKEIEDMMEKLERNLTNRKPITKLINPIIKKAEQPLPQVEYIYLKASVKET